LQTIRTFIAIELSSQAQTALADLQNRLKAMFPPRTVRWVPVGNIHLTIHFLGDVLAGQTSLIQKQLEMAASQTQPFFLQFAGLGSFPNTHRPRVIWTGVHGQTTPLKKLHQTLEERLKIISFLPDNRPYAPHLTLGRVQKQITSRQLKKLAESLQKIQPEVGLLASMDVTAVSLMQSELKPSGAVYTCLGQGHF
jgi:2'-5' RNA ligase